MAIGVETLPLWLLWNDQFSTGLHWTPPEHMVFVVFVAPVFRETVGRSTLEYEAVALVTCGMIFRGFRLIFVRPLENTLTRCRDQCEAEEFEKSLFQ